MTEDTRSMNDKIVIKDHRDTIEIGFEDIEKYAGQEFIAMAAVTFKAIQAAFEALFPDSPPQREEISIQSGHPGQGVRDAFEMVTRAVTRSAYKVDTTRPQARLNPGVDISYSFDITTADGRRVEVALKEGVLPARFFELFKAVRRVPNSNSEQAELDRLKQEFDQLKRTLAAQIRTRPTSELFTLRVSAPKVMH